MGHLTRRPLTVIITEVLRRYTMGRQVPLMTTLHPGIKMKMMLMRRTLSLRNGRGAYFLRRLQDKVSAALIDVSRHNREL